MSEKRSEMVALNADVVGYSRLIADDLEATTATMDEYRDLVAMEVVQNGGTLVNFVGDNFMAVFDDTRAAMRTAIAITTEIETRHAAPASARPARFRMGMDLGPVTVSDNEYFGDALNIAARIQAIAQPGGISVSGRVYQALDEPALRFRPIGRYHLKNIAEEVDVFEFADLPGDGAGTSSPRSLRPESPTVAVLPIHAEMADEDLQAMAGVFRADLIHRLSRIPQLHVIDARAEPDVVGLPGAARYLIETGVHQAGDRVRVYASLVDVASMNVVKSHKHIAQAADLFAASEAFADEVGIARNATGLRFVPWWPPRAAPARDDCDAECAAPVGPSSLSQ